MTDSPKFHAVFIATSTEEKIRDFNLIAKKKKLPIKFFNLEKITGTLHNTLEDGGSATENADKKLKGVQGKIESCRNHPEDIQAFCEQEGLDYAPERIWFGTEDSGVTMPKEIWNHIPKDILSVLPEEVQKRLEKLEREEGIAGPNVDTAPFLSATLGGANFRTICEAGIAQYEESTAERIDHEKLIFKEESVLKLEPLLPDKGTKKIPVLTIEGKTYNSYSAITKANPDPIHVREANYAYLEPKKRYYDHKTASELGNHYITNYSARAAAIDDLRLQLDLRVEHGQMDEEHRLKPVANKNDLWTGIAKEPAEFNVGLVNLNNDSDTDKITKSLRYEGAHLKHVFEDAERPFAGDATNIKKATYYLSYPERVLSKSDGLILLPDSARGDKPTSLAEKLYMLSSIVVAKQLIARDKNKPVTIINTDHSWDKAIQIHTQLANVQMTKDFTIPPSRKLADVEVKSNGYFSVIDAQDKIIRNSKGQPVLGLNDTPVIVPAYEVALKAAAYVMKDASLTYHRVSDAKPKTETKGESPYDDKPKKYTDPRNNLVAIFCSASSENAPLNKFVSEISYGLVNAGKGVVCGGGDRYTMGAILDGVMNFRLKTNTNKKDAYIAGITTEPIVAAETNKGEIPSSYSYSELTPNIYERMAKMLVPSKTLLVAPGGIGTVQEWMGFEMLKQKMPTLFKDKKLVIFDPDLMNSTHPSLQNKVFNDTLRVFFGDNFDKLKQGTMPKMALATSVNEALRECGAAQSKTR